MKKNQIRVALLVLVLLFAASIGWAQPRDNPIERARHHMELGQEAFNQGQYENAADQFISAYSASPFSAFLYNAGFAYEKARNNEKAVDFYRRYLDAEPEAPDYAKVDVKIRALLAGAETTVEEMEADGVEMKSLISVRTNPPDATIRILDKEGNELSKTDKMAAQTVVRGTYTVEASHPDYRTVQTDINVSAGQVYIVVVEMSQGAFLGFLHITTDVPGAAVYIDDKSTGQTGITPWGNVLTAGKHMIWVEKPGYQTIQEEMEINLGEERDLDLTLERLPFGTLLVKTNTPGSRVFLDEAPLGEAPLDGQAKPGKHKLLVKAEGMKDYQADVVVERGQTTKVLVRMNHKPSRTSAWVSLGFAAALFAGGGVAGFMALDLHNDLDSARNKGRLANDDPRILHGFLWAMGADLAFGVGAIVGSLSIYYFLRDPLPPSEGRLFDPVDFKENPVEGVSSQQEHKVEPANEQQPATEQPATGTEAQYRPRLILTPLLSTEIAGLGVIMTF